MRSVSGACGRVLFGVRTPPYAIIHIVHTGQSLAVGLNQTPVSTTQPYQNLKVFDSLGVEDGYVLADPNAPTLSLVPLVSPQRTIVSTSSTLVYPENVCGESAEIAFANQLALLYHENSYSTPIVIASCVGRSSTSIGGISEGQVPFTAGIYEANVIANKGGDKTYGSTAVLLTHGETDAANNATNGIQTPTAYLASLQTLQSDYVTALHGTFNQGNEGPVPMFLSPQSTFPGQLQGINTTALACLMASQQSPALFVNIGPKYQMNYTEPPHLGDYRPLGEKYAEVYYAVVVKTATWFPTWMTSITVDGSIVSVAYNVPFAPLVFDTSTVSPPHQSGNWAAWALGNGFTARDNLSTVTGATNTSPIEITLAAPPLVPLVTGQSYSLWQILGNTAANGTWPTITVIDDTHFTLDGSTGNGAYTASSGQGFSVVGIASTPTISGNTVTIELSRTPGADVLVGYAIIADGAYNAIGGDPMVGCLRDSDPFRGRSFYDTVNPIDEPGEVFCNWAMNEEHSVPYTIAVP